ncbi:MAG: molybdopterin molybdotransferase MoeA [Rhodobacteraceae bacterium]|nr:molybdopterin molybdotransferase MoeA [Paracoccaceae bacterium]
MISVKEALAGVLELFGPLDSETVPLSQAAGRTLAEDVVATRDQPPFAASTRDGYAVTAADVAPGVTLTVIGEAAAGRAFNGTIGSGRCVRIFTGAPVPESADRILMQENCKRVGDTITVSINSEPNSYVRPAGGDFKAGDGLLAPLRIGPSESALLASMNIPTPVVRRKPKVALVATGNELVMPGECPGSDQIFSSNNFGLKALVEAHGAEAMMLPIARDNELSLRYVLDLAQSADVIVTLGGASVGDYDLVHKTAGPDMSFYKIAMHPGKLLMAGRLNSTPMIGLPGNPVATMVCSHIFLIPAIRAMLGFDKGPLPRENAVLGKDVKANGPRSHYMPAMLSLESGHLTSTPFDRRDSSLHAVLSQASCLMVRDPSDPAKSAGQTVQIIRL